MKIHILPYQAFVNFFGLFLFSWDPRSKMSSGMQKSYFLEPNIPFCVYLILWFKGKNKYQFHKASNTDDQNYLCKFVDNTQQCFAFTPQANFPANNLNFHWRWRWWDWIQAIFLNLFYFMNDDAQQHWKWQCMNIFRECKKQLARF